MNPRTNTAVFIVGMTALLCLIATGLLWLIPAAAARPEGLAGIEPAVLQWGFMAAAVATGASSLGAGIAVASVGSAAIGALAEKPELLGRVLIMVGLAEGIAIYGLIISILILNQLT
jgi:V/A-type H+-transporting ATPase subunit K